MVEEKTRPPSCFLFVILRNLHLYSRMLQCYHCSFHKHKSHSMTVWSSPLRYLPQRLVQKPQCSCHCGAPSNNGDSTNWRTGLPRLYCALWVRACQLLSRLRLEIMGIWDTILCNAIFKEILHNSSRFSPLFWRAFLKVSLADPFNLTSLWSCSAKSWRLGFATSHGMGWYRNDNEVVFWKEWMN